MMIAYVAILGLLGIFCINTCISIQSIGEIELEFSVEDFVNDMYKGHRYGRDDWLYAEHIAIFLALWFLCYTVGIIFAELTFGGE